MIILFLLIDKNLLKSESEGKHAGAKIDTQGSEPER